MRHIIIVGWTSIISSFLLMTIGHLGTHDLSWVSSQISTYAATAPYDYLVTTSILLSSLSLLIVGILVSKYKILGSSYFAHLVPALSGAAAAGLIMVAYYEETAKTISLLKQSGFWAIRVQTFHDAGLFIFFNSALLLVMLLGILAIIYNSKKINKILGVVVFSVGPVSYFLMTTRWPKLIGFEGVTTGVNQRAALFFLWVAVTIVLVMASNKSLQPTTNAPAELNR